VVYTLWWYCSLYWSVGLGKELSRPWENIWHRLQPLVTSVLNWHLPSLW
jgi:hypothetical protein